MSGLKKRAKKLGRSISRLVRDPLKSIEKGYKSVIKRPISRFIRNAKRGSRDLADDIGLSSIVPGTGAKPGAPPEEPVLPFPDEDELRRAARRRLSRRAQSGGRASTILDEDDSL